MANNKLKSIIESLLFISTKPLSIRKLAELTQAEKQEVEEAVENLIQEYNSQEKGIQIVRHSEKVQMVTHPKNARIIQAFLKDEMTGELTKPGLETLTIVAYRGPITKAELEQIRGVNCSLILRNLMIKGLIEAKEDRQAMVTRYNVTFEFLRYLGLRDVRELPDYEKLSKNEVLENFLK
jgi:segregation and condensation protein B